MVDGYSVGHVALADLIPSLAGFLDNSRDELEADFFLVTSFASIDISFPSIPLSPHLIMYGITRALRASSASPLRYTAVSRSPPPPAAPAYPQRASLTSKRFNSGKVSGPVIGIDLGTTNSCVS
jgi:hypothetical protein